MKKTLFQIIFILILPSLGYTIDLKFFDEAIKIINEKSYYKKTEFELKLSLFETLRDKLGLPIKIYNVNKNSAEIEYNTQKLDLNNSNFNKCALIFEKDLQQILSKYKLDIELDEYIVFLLCAGIDKHIFLSKEPYIENKLISALDIDIKNDFFVVENVNKKIINTSEEVNNLDTIIKINSVPIKFLTYGLIVEISKKESTIELESKNDKKIKLSLKDSSFVNSSNSNNLSILHYEINNNNLIITENDNFSAYDDLEKQLKKIVKNKKNLKSVIFDLRNCNGGLLKSINEISKLFVDGNNLLYTMRMNSEDLNINSTFKGAFYGIPINIIINKKTFGGAELFCHILKIKADAKTIGTRTIGRGHIYNTYPIQTKNYLIMFRSGELILPNGNSLNNNGLIPDIEYEKDDILEFVKK